MIDSGIWESILSLFHDQKFIRQHYVALKEGKAIDWSVHHDLHCFDSLRQSIMCTANDNLLYATGHKDTGYGQVVRCKDWDMLRNWLRNELLAIMISKVL